MLLLNLQKLWKGLRPIVFFPGTLVRTWGTRPGPIGSARAQTLPRSDLEPALLTQPSRTAVFSDQVVAKFGVSRIESNET
jgi:hypothetical protein